MSPRPPGGTCPALVHRSLPCQSTTVCSSKRWTCRGGSSPRTRGAARDPSDHGVAVRPLPNSALVSTCVESSATTASAHGPQRAPIGRTKHSSRCGRSIVHPSRPPRISPVYPLIGYLRGSFRPPDRSGGPQDVDQRSPCPPAHGAQNAQIWTASVVMGIKPTPAQIGGYLRIAADQRWLQTVIRFQAGHRAKR